MSETFLYLTTVGRVTGNPHRIEIWYVAHDGCFYLCAEHGEKSDWVKNVIQDASVQFAVHDRETSVEPYAGVATIVRDEDEIGTLSALFDAKYNWSKGLFVKVCGVDS